MQVYVLRLQTRQAHGGSGDNTAWIGILCTFGSLLMCATQLYSAQVTSDLVFKGFYTRRS